MSSGMLNRCDRTCLLDACPHFHDKQTDLIFVCSVLFQIFVGWLSSYQDLFVCCRVQLGKSRMKVPCRSVTCDHLQCFDAVTYLRMNEKKPTWFCPVCDRHAEYSKLIVDGFVAWTECMCCVVAMRCYAIAAYVCVMRCLSVCLSHLWIMSKRINISSEFFHCWVATPF